MSADAESSAINWREFVALEVNGEKITLPELLSAAQFHGQLAFLQSIADAALIRQAAAQQNIAVADEELQAAANEFRAQHELHKAAELMRWLADSRLTLGAWESLLEDEILARKLRAHLTEGKVEMYFAQNKLAFDHAIIARIVVASEGLARELRAQIAEEDADFHALARRHSQDAATRVAGGYASIVRRSDLNSLLEAAVFGAPAGTVVGPFKIDAGWELVKVETRQTAQLDEATRAQIAEIIFADWLTERRNKAHINAPLLDLLAEEEE